MSTPADSRQGPDPRREHPSTYFVQDRSNQEELIRLQIQDQMFTAGMGGVLPEQTDPTRFHRVLDVGCGPGGWLIEVAKAYPDIERLIGVDISGKMVQYARQQAEAQGVSRRVEFQVMDALRMLEFPAHFFDLVNQRFALGWLRTWEWRKLLQEYRRVTQPGGVIRLTENELQPQSSSPAFSRYWHLYQTAFHQAGHLFTPMGNGVTDELARLLDLHGLQHIQMRAYTLEYRAGTPGGEHLLENVRYGGKTGVAFLRKWMRLPDDYNTLYEQTLREMQQSDFVATVGLLTAWGTNPSGFAPASLPLPEASRAFE